MPRALPATALPATADVAGSRDAAVARFHLRAAAFRPSGRRAMAALAARGEAWTHEVLPGDAAPATLRLGTGLGAAQATGPIAMLDLVAAAARTARRPPRPPAPSWRRAPRRGNGSRP